MKLVITRVDSASVAINGAIYSEIEKGLLVLVGVSEEDSEHEAEYLSKKVAELRIFADDAGKLNQSCTEHEGEILVVSNFTLYADCKKGNRPSFIRAARPERAEPLYEYFCGLLRKRGYCVKTGVFGADMLVSSVNYGPVTIVMDTAEML